MRWRFVLPLPPSVNQQYTERDGRRVLSREARHYKHHLQKAFRQLKASGKLARPQEHNLSLLASLFPEEGESATPSQTPPLFLGLRLEFFFKTPQRRDLDNGLKIVQDLVCESLGVDDRNVVHVELIKRVDAQNPRLEVTVIALPEWSFTVPKATADAIDLRSCVPPLSPLRKKTKKGSFSLSEWLEQRAEKEIELP